jgi:hypothetical protein
VETEVETEVEEGSLGEVRERRMSITESGRSEGKFNRKVFVVREGEV